MKKEKEVEIYVIGSLILIHMLVNILFMVFNQPTWLQFGSEMANQDFSELTQAQINMIELINNSAFVFFVNSSLFLIATFDFIKAYFNRQQVFANYLIAGLLVIGLMLSWQQIIHAVAVAK